MSGFFTGIQVPNEVVRRAIREFPIRDTLDTAIWTLPCNWHSTLEWHGGDEPDDDYLFERLKYVRPFDLKMVRPYVFRNTATYLCADLTGDLVSWGVLSRGTAPHVTLARPVPEAQPERFDALPGWLKGWQSDWWTVEEVCLYESNNGHYKIIETCPLEQI